MKVTSLPINPFTYSLLHKVNAKILEWDLEPLVGKALYSKHHSAGYLELKMYFDKQNEYSKNEIIWNIPDYPIAVETINYKLEIQEGLSAFIKYMSALRGESMYLTFEINDIAFDITSTMKRPFENATIYALISCFDKEIIPFFEERIKGMKDTTAWLLERNEPF